MNSSFTKMTHLVMDKLENISELQACVLRQSFKAFDECIVYYDSFEKVIILYGPGPVINDCKLQLVVKLENIAQETVKISPNLYTIFSRKKGKQYLEYIQVVYEDVKIILEEECLFVAAIGEDRLNHVIIELREKIYLQSFSSEVDISIDQLYNIKEKLEAGLLVIVSWDACGRKIQVEGIKDDVMVSQREILLVINNEKRKKNRAPENEPLPLCKTCLKNYELKEERQKINKQNAVKVVRESSFKSVNRDEKERNNSVNPKLEFSEENYAAPYTDDFSKHTFNNSQSRSRWEPEKNLLDDKVRAQVPPRSTFGGRGGRTFVVRKQSYDAGYSNEYSRTSQQDMESRNDEHSFPRVNSDQSDCQVHHLTQLNSGRQRVVDNSEETIETQKRVKELEHQLKEMQLENELIKKNPQNITDKLENISELQAYFLQPFFKKLGEFTILYLAHDKSVVINGPESDIQECKFKILKELKSIVDDTLRITPLTYSIISRPKGKRFLEDIQTEFKEIKLFLEEHQLLVASKDENILTKAMFKLKDTINSSHIFRSNVELSIDKLLALKTSLESDLLVSVTWNDDGREIKVEGIKDDVMASQREIKDLLDEHGVTEKKFVVKGLEANFLQMCFKEQIESILSNLKIVSYVSGDTQLSITYSGPKLQTLEASNRLIDLQSSVVSKKWDLKDDFKAHEIMLITNSLKSGTLKEKIEKFIYKEKCLIITKELSFYFNFLLPDSNSEESESSSDDDTTLILLDSKNIGKTEIHIITKAGNKFDNLKKMIIKEMTDNCLTVDYFNQDVMPHWPSSSKKKIIEHAKKLSVWIEKSRHPKSKKAGFFIKGEKQLVVQMKVFIQKEFSYISRHFPKRSLTSDKVPKRGTLEFMQYAAESDELFPSYWNLNKSKSFWKSFQDKMSLKSAKGNVLVSVDDATKSAIISLVKNTMEPGLIGAGADAAGLNYRNIQVLNVERVENLHLFEQYGMRRKRLFEKAVRTGKICPDIGKLQGSKGRVRTTELLDDCLKKELYYEVNEHYLFHGTKSDNIDTLIHNGLDPRLSSEGGMFGRGIYAAEIVTKSDQYSDQKNQRVRNGTQLKLFLTRMLLGNVFLCDSNHKSVAGKDSKKLSRPPCTHCFQDICKCKPQVLFDSVMGDGKWNFREFVVYDASQCYPEYVITYKRV
ncbi:uncharacterized protein LOC131943044 [Physella acuta]|uniref:uncharacterized protein LOC131943044 n=1 Tax=Physella acuta TaxID=109671 RepID=UPI0027DD92B1|nr:uncharacterized protein LOC131943044 [Physella acuta]